MSKPWHDPSPPRKILAIRLQAMGDMVITLPYLNALRTLLPPGTAIDFLTRREVAAIPTALKLFNRVYAIGGGRNERLQFAHAAMMWPKLFAARYDAVVDLQHNRLSDAIRTTLRPKAWVAFDRFSPQPAGERTRQTIEALGLGSIRPVFDHPMKKELPVDPLLVSNGWQSGHSLVVLNPAGAFKSRSWPLEYYVAFAEKWSRRFPETQFLVMGVWPAIAKAAALKALLGADLVDLTGKTDAAQAFALIQKAAFVLSEDSGLMHMAWVSGIPTLALFGSTRSDWARPLGPHSSWLDSSDMACGNCMLEQCRFTGTAGENECMNRYTPEIVFEAAVTLLLQHTESRSRAR